MANEPPTIKVPYIAYAFVWASLIALSSIFVRSDNSIFIAGLLLLPVAYLVTNQIAWFIRNTYKHQTSKVTIISSSWQTPAPEEHGDPPADKRARLSERPTTVSSPKRRLTDRDKAISGVLLVLIIAAVGGVAYNSYQEEQARIAARERRERRIEERRVQEEKKAERERVARELKEVTDKSLASLEKSNREMAELAQRMREAAASRQREKEAAEARQREKEIAEARQGEEEAAPKTRQLEICNRSNCELFVGTVEYMPQKSQWFTAAWFSVPAHGCKKIGDYPVGITSYVYAQQNQANCPNRLRWSGPYKFCLPYSSLSRVTNDLPTQCNAQGDEVMGFSEFEVGRGFGDAHQLVFTGN